MGNDGGSIPTRRELVKPTTTLPASETAAARAQNLSHAWRHDALTQTPLKPPIVADALGRLYNKEAVIEMLVARAAGGGEGEEEGERERERGKGQGGKDAVVDVVRGVRDVVEVRGVFGAEEGEERGWRCPVTEARLGVPPEGARAVYLVPCGHVFSAAGVREAMGAADGEGEGVGRRCVVCETGFGDGDVVGILPAKEEEIEGLRRRLVGLRERGLAHSGKKDRSAAKEKGGKEGSKKRKKRDVEEVEKGWEDEVKGINNAATASLTAKVRQEQDAAKKRKQAGENDNVRSLFSTRDQSKPGGQNGDFMTRGFTVPAKAK